MDIRPLIYSLVICMMGLACNQQDSQLPTDSKKKGKNTILLTEKTACLMSQLVYLDNPEYQIGLYLPGWVIVWKSNESGGNHAIIAANGDNYAVAFRGSLINFTWDALQNWIYQDLNIATLQKWPFATDSTKAQVAQGDYDSWKNTSFLTDKSSGKTIYQFLEEKISIQTGILLTGHSLGGNIAITYGSYLWNQFQHKSLNNAIINVISFAAPASGNDVFANDFNMKFPHAIRYENKHDIVPKSPCTKAIKAVGNLFRNGPDASKITVGYKDLSVSLKTVFTMIKTAMIVLEFKNGNAEYTQTSGDGTLLDIPLSGKYLNHSINDWLAEAAYQHAMATYAANLGVPVIE